MNTKQVIKLSVAILFLGYSSLVVTASSLFEKHQDTRELLSAMNSRLEDRDKLAALFRVGDERITDLIQALDDPSPEISLRAQIVIRYLGNDVGMKALLEWYDRRKQFTVAGPIPLPLREWDYKVIYANYVGKPPETWTGTEPYIYALALDDSHRAKEVLKELTKSAGNLDEATVAGRALARVQANQPAILLTGQKDLSKLVLNNAFFVMPEDQKYTTARLLALNRAKDKALVEIYISRGRLSEEWYHVVIKKRGQGWEFFSITQVAVS